MEEPRCATPVPAIGGRQTLSGRARAGLCAIFLLGGFLMTPEAWGQDDKRAPKIWKAELEGRPVELLLDGEALLTMREGEALDRVSLGAVVGLALETEAEHPVVNAIKGQAAEHWNAALQIYAETGDPRVFVAAPVNIAAGTALLAPFLWIKTQNHFIGILSYEDGVRRSHRYRLRGRNARRLLNALSGGSGSGWAHLDLEQDIPQNRGWRTTLRFKVITALQRIYFLPGNYHVVFLESGGGRGMLYVFPGEDSKLEQMMAAFAVRVAPAPGAENFAAVLRAEPDGAVHVVEFRKGGKALRLLPAPSPQSREHPYPEKRKDEEERR